MRAIIETVFDIFYLVTVLTLGIRMIRGSKTGTQFRLFGLMAVVLGAGDSFHLVPRALALCTTGLENYAVPLGLGKWITSVTMTVFYVLLYYVWRKRYQIEGQKDLTIAVYALSAVRILLCMMPQNQWLTNPHPADLGYPAQHPLCTAGPANHRAVLPQRQGTQGSGLPLDVADHRAELRLLYPGGAVGRCQPPDRYADDPQDLRLRLDRADRLQRHESRERQEQLRTSET